MKQVTAGIIFRDGKILVAQRPESDSLAGKWEFPGGKIEPGETAEQCLSRELDEELGLTVQIDSFFCSSTFTYPKGQIELLAFLCSKPSAPTKMNSHSEIRWVEPQHLLSLDLAPADVPIAEKLAARM